MKWAVITGEYPPQPGGVSDYTRLVASGLAALGDEVHVWAPECSKPSGADDGVMVHRLPGHYGLRALRRLDQEIEQAGSSRLLVQYVPHVFGWKAMNVPFCLWLRARKQPVWSMFHEVHYPRRRKQRAAEHLLGAVTYEMAQMIASCSDRIFCSTSAWLPMLESFAHLTKKTPLPVPSNIPERADSEAASTLRSQMASVFEPVVIGHFGTYSAALQNSLNTIFAPLLHADAHRVALFAGRGSEEFRRVFLRHHNVSANRVRSIETACGNTMASYLAICDVIVQPYPDGVTTRRSSLMASLALGRPVVTNRGPLTEPLWQESGAVELVADGNDERFVAAVEHLLSDPQERRELGIRAAQTYDDCFALRHTLETLREDA